MTRWLLIVLAGATALGCVGKAQVGDPPDLASDAGTRDAAMTADIAVVPDMGTQPDPLCIGVTCLPNAECGRGSCWCSAGFMGDPTTGCTAGNPCEGSSCTFGATCNDDGQCLCDVGWQENLTACDPIVDEFPLERTEADVCARWRTDYPETAGVVWQTQPTEPCDPGELDPALQLDAVRRVSLYRWLVGLQAVTTTVDRMREAQACATALGAQNAGATNVVTEDFTCYSADAAVGASSSSVVLGPPSPAAAVDRFIEDDMVGALGNRRWILNPDMGATGFGFRDGYTCMYAIDTNGASNPQYIAYPFGVFPSEALRGRWMWASSQLFANDGTMVTVTDSAGTALAVTNIEVLEPSIFPGAVAWEVTGAAPGAYTVAVTGLNGAVNELSYPVTIVNCP